MGGVNSPPQGWALHTSARAQQSAASPEHEVLKASGEEKLSADNRWHLTAQHVSPPGRKRV